MLQIILIPSFQSKLLNWAYLPICFNLLQHDELLVALSHLFYFIG